MKTAAFRVAPRLAPVIATFAIVATLFSACGDDAAPVPADLLAGDQAFVAVPRTSTADVVEARSALTNGAGGAGAMGVQPGENNFYLAIRKDVLAQPWFLSAYLKQGQDRVPYTEVPFFSLGTRVVSFQVQNGKLFVFDASDQHAASAVIAPPNLLEAYPLVDLPEFNRLRGADRYVLVDPSAGLNPFGITSDLYEDWPFRGLSIQGDYGDLRMRVGVSFMQNFRSLADGVTFDEIFTGDIAGVDPAPFTIWGTLGLSIRRYAVGEGYEPTPDPVDPLYFATGYRSIPDSGGAVYHTPVKWNFHRGMSPVKIYVNAGAKRAQAHYPGVDLLGAFKRGIESWNDVLGFKVFEAVFVDDDQIRDDDKSFLLVDFPGIGFPYSFADYRANPINGEIRGVSVYFSGAFLPGIEYMTDDPPAGGAPAAAANATAPTSAPAASANLPLLSWAGMAAHPTCAYSARASAMRAANARAATAGSAPLTGDQKRALYVQHVVAHEFGHTLGLRHNFAGSLEPPSSSVMDYLDDDLAIKLPTPGAYDREAISYLYGLSPDLPTHPFCTDEHVPLSPLCQRNDRGADPLYDAAAPVYAYVVGLILDGVVPGDPNGPYGSWA
ncbi:MAG TPA: zinc-dependent metalloprotease, partial [Polyangia bacterium]|nr:zinc-dependent metalloprotease [Polyangia bacterium]